MKTKILLIIIACLFSSQNSHAYFVRPFVTFGAGTSIDGLIVDGATQNDVGFGGSNRQARANVNLATGEMKLFAAASGPGTSASGQGVMGDSLTFRNGAGTNATLSFSLDAILHVDVFQDTLDSPLFTWGVTLGVFERGLVDHTDWFGRSSEAVFFGSDSDSITDPDEDISGLAVNPSVEAIIPLSTDNEIFDVFFNAFLFGGSGSLGQITSFAIDGENTASANVNTALGVDVYSESGVFLGFASDPNLVPVPPTMAILGAGLIILGFIRNSQPQSR
jgi:hypothetical protein